MKHSYKFISVILSLSLCLSFFCVVPVFAQNNEPMFVSSVGETNHDCSECANVETKSDPVGVVLTQASPDEILSRLVSKEKFSLDGSLVNGNQVKDLNDCYDFASMSRFEIADWAYQSDLISEAQKIESYCDLIESRIFENAVCLDSFYSEIEAYANKNLISASLNEKIAAVLDTSKSQNSNTRDEIHYIEVSGILIDDVDNILSDEALNAIGEYVSSLRTIFINRGFTFPNNPHPNGREDFVISLNSSTTGTVLHTNTFVQVSTNTRLITSFIYGVNNNTVLNDTLRQRIAHGMFHAIQDFCYYESSSNSTPHKSEWFRDACADWGAWSTTGLTTGINFNAFINARGCMTQNIGNGAILFPVTIARYYGGYETIVEIYEQLSTVTTTILPFSTLENKINAALAARGYTSVDFADIFSQMSGYLAVPSSIYSFVASGLQNTFNAGEITYYEGADFTEDDIRKLDRAYFSFTPDEDLIDYEIEFEVGVLGNPNGDVTVQQFWYNDIGEAMIEYLPLNANGVVSFSHPHFDEGNPSGFVGIIITNTNADAEYGFYIDYVVTQN